MIEEIDVRKAAAAMAAARRAKGFSRTTLAASAGIGLQSIRNYETGRNLPGLANLNRICLALGMSIDEYTGFRARRREYEASNMVHMLPVLSDDTVRNELYPTADYRFRH